MGDPIQELESFTPPGLTVDPLPASEVRRRGSRLQRRNRALAVVAGVAAVAVVAVPFGIVSAHHDSSAPEPSSRWTQTIPSGLPLTAGMPDGTTTSHTSAVDPIEACGTTAWSAAASVRPVDAAGASYSTSGSEAVQDRTLALYADDTAAIAAMTRLQHAISSCPTDDSGSGAPLVNEVVAGEADPDLYVFTNEAKDGDLLYDLTLYEVSRSGNALLLDTTHTSAGFEQAGGLGLVDRFDRRSRPVRDALCVFTGSGC